MSIADYVAVAKRIGFADAASVVEAVGSLDGSPDAIAGELRSHHLLGFVQHAARQAGAEARLPADLERALAAQRPIQRAAPATLLATFDEVRRSLRDAEIA